jgi:segregation and condensation protein A
MLEYRRIKEAALALAEVHQLRQGVWPRPPVELASLAAAEEPSLDLSELSLYDLLQSLHRVLDRFDREHPPPWHVDRESYSVRDQLLRLHQAIPASSGLDLLRDLRERSCRAEVIAAFLAVLELLRLHLARLHQTAGGTLWLHRTDRKLQHEELEAIPS